MTWQKTAICDLTESKRTSKEEEEGGRAHTPQPQSTRRICRRRRPRRLAARRRPPARLWTSPSLPSSSSDSALPSPPIGFCSVAAVLAVADSVSGLRTVIRPRMWVPQRTGGGILEACWISVANGISPRKALKRFLTRRSPEWGHVYFVWFAI